MAGATGLLITLVGAALGLACLLAGPIALFAGPLVRRPRWGLALALVSGGVSLLAILLTSPVWGVVLSGTSTRGEAVDRASLGLPLAVMLVEAAALGCAVAATVRHARALRSGAR